MAKLNDLFQRYLSDINPDSDAVSYAVEAHKPIREHLEQDKEFGKYFVDSFLYGSYRRHTAVGDIKDVDIVVLTNFDPESAIHTPKYVLAKLKAALTRYYEDPENPQYQRRSIRIDDPLPHRPDVKMTLDIVAAVLITTSEQPLLVPDREVGKWVMSHPKGHLANTTKLNCEQYSNGRFVPLVKAVKWWWKYQCETRQPDVERPKPKGFWLECLVGESFDRECTTYADHFISVLEAISAKYANPRSVPELKDPGLIGAKIQTSMTLPEFRFFMDVVEDCLIQARKAYLEEDRLRSSLLWRDIFGAKFPLYDEQESEESRQQTLAVPIEDVSHAKPLIWPEQPSRAAWVRIDAYVHVRGGTTRGGINSNGRTLPSGVDIEYKAKTNVRGSYEVHWQVVNTGRHARENGGLRGGFFPAKAREGGPSGSSLVNWEHTEYTGKHWIECFIVQDGRCVARSGRFYIAIKNPGFK